MGAGAAAGGRGSSAITCPLLQPAPHTVGDMCSPTQRAPLITGGLRNLTVLPLYRHSENLKAPVSPSGPICHVLTDTESGKQVRVILLRNMFIPLERSKLVHP